MSTTPRRPGRPKGARTDPAERRGQLLDHAEAAIRTHGAAVSMEQIAEHAGVSKATLYDNFDGKGGLTQALLERNGLKILQAFADGLGQRLTPRQVVRGGVGIFVSFIEDDPEIYRFIVVHAAGTSVMEETATPIAVLLGSVLRQAGRDSGGAELFAHAVLGSVFAATEWWAEHRSMSREDFVDYLIDFVWAGLAGAAVEGLDDPIDLTTLARALAGSPGVELPPDAAP